MFSKELPPLSCLDRDRMMEWETGFGMDRISRARDETEALRAIKTRRITGETSWHPWECRSRNLPWRGCFVNSLASRSKQWASAVHRTGAGGWWAQSSWTTMECGCKWLKLLVDHSYHGHSALRSLIFFLMVKCLAMSSEGPVSCCVSLLPVMSGQWLAPAPRRRRARAACARPAAGPSPTRTRNARNLTRRSGGRGASEKEGFSRQGKEENMSIV